MCDRFLLADHFRGCRLFISDWLYWPWPGLPVLAWMVRGLVKYSESPAKLVPHIVVGAATIYLISIIIIISLIF